jgi:hypothetical protein
LHRHCPVAAHLRRTIPLLGSLTLDDFHEALDDLRPQIAELIDSHCEED